MLELHCFMIGEESTVVFFRYFTIRFINLLDSGRIYFGTRNPRDEVVICDINISNGCLRVPGHQRCGQGSCTDRWNCDNRNCGRYRIRRLIFYFVECRGCDGRLDFHFFGIGGCSLDWHIVPNNRRLLRNGVYGESVPEHILFGVHILSSFFWQIRDWGICCESNDASIEVGLFWGQCGDFDIIY